MWCAGPYEILVSFPLFGGGFRRKGARGATSGYISTMEQSVRHVACRREYDGKANDE